MPDIVHLEVAYTQSFNLDRQTYCVLRTQPCMSGRILKWHIHNKPARCIAGRAVVPAQQKRQGSGRAAVSASCQRASANSVAWNGRCAHTHAQAHHVPYKHASSHGARIRHGNTPVHTGGRIRLRTDVTQEWLPSTRPCSNSQSIHHRNKQACKPQPHNKPR